MTKVPELKELMKAGVHFGHQKSKWHPKMAPFIFSEKSGVHVINLEETQNQIEIAIKFAQETVKNGGNVLFLSTKKQAKAIVKEAAISCGMPYIISRWLGGTLTNAISVLNLVKKYRKLIKEKESGEIKKYTKKEQLQLGREMIRLDDLIGGISNITKIPNAIFIIDVKLEKTAVLEANKMSVPIIALCDTNVNVSRVDYPIPANDDASSSIKLIVNTIAKAIKDVQTDDSSK